MELTLEQFKIIEPMFPKQTGNVKINDFELMNTMLYFLKNGCKLKELLKKFRLDTEATENTIIYALIFIYGIINTDAQVYF
jgi:hypothetical protein